jgi:hypothetical protein
MKIDMVAVPENGHSVGRCGKESENANGKAWIIRARWSFGKTGQDESKRIMMGSKNGERGEDYLK